MNLLGGFSSFQRKCNLFCCCRCRCLCCGKIKPTKKNKKLLITCVNISSLLLSLATRTHAHPASCLSPNHPLKIVAATPRSALYPLARNKFNLLDHKQGSKRVSNPGCSLLSPPTVSLTHSPALPCPCPCLSSSVCLVHNKYLIVVFMCLIACCFLLFLFLLFLFLLLLFSLLLCIEL